ncbi:hypothetical protein O181_078761 [Austropuccinia psidii MF-1]|uniref:Uncharacterized protein n=1 Tax=Austropuccinia psidii MF-1 TaxID=1389203 RepID=A0A9Q3FKL0_9BASI|nr:hypothetical protein [Austropuccinia psidii MF-1]
MINVEVGHTDNQPPHTESPPYSMKQSMMKPLPPLVEIFKPFKKGRQLIHDTMGQDMTDIIPDPESKVSSSASFEGIFLSRMEELGDTLNYHSNITQQSWKRELDNINRIYKNCWDNLATEDAHTFLPLGIKVISNGVVI